MKILIIGGGSVGFIVAEYFANEEHDVTIVESRNSRVNIIRDTLDVNVVEGKGTDLNVLRLAGVDKADIFLALSDNSETNIIACTLAKFSNVKIKLARLNDANVLVEENLSSLKELGVDEIIHTQDNFIEAIVKSVLYPGVTDYKYFMDKKYVIACFSFGRQSVYYGKPIKDITFDFPARALSCSKMGIHLPYNEDYIINEFLYVHYFVESKNLENLRKKLFPESKEIEKIMIFGGSHDKKDTSVLLAKSLVENGYNDITMVDNSLSRAQYLASKCSHKVLHGDPSKPYYNKFLHVEDVDMFIAISDDYEKNLFSCSFAYHNEVPYTISMVRFPDHVQFISTIPITSFVNPAIITANKIIRYHSTENIISRTIISYKSIECIEFIVTEKSQCFKKKLSDIDLSDSIVLSVKRKNVFIDVNDNTIFESGDMVLLFLFEKDKKLFKKII